METDLQSFLFSYYRLLRYFQPFGFLLFHRMCEFWDAAPGSLQGSRVCRIVRYSFFARPRERGGRMCSEDVQE